MRIAILANSFPPQSLGGAAKIAREQAVGLQEQGFEVCVWLPEPYNTHEDILNIKTFKPQTTFKFVDLNHTPRLYRLIFHIEDLGANLNAVEEIRNWKPDIIITHNLTGCGWSTAKILQKTGIKWVHLLHDVQAFEPSGQIFYNEKTSFLKAIWRWFWSSRRKASMGSPDLVVSPSNWLLSEHIKQRFFTQSKYQVVPNPLPDVNGFENAEIDEQPTVVFVGRLEFDKGFDLLLQAWNSVQKSVPNCKLKVIGTGSLRYLLTKDDPRIIFCGELEHNQVMEQLKTSNVLVFTSRLLENYPTVLLEAISLRKNIVANDVGGVAELLNGYGYIVPPGDSAQLKQALVLSMQNPPNTAKCSELIKTHDHNKIMRQWIEIIESL